MKNIAKIRVIYADTDAMGIVYHTNYIRWFEIGRTELLRDMGFVYSEWEKKGYNLPLTQVFCHYLMSAVYDQILLVETEVEYVKRASIKFKYKIWDEKHEKELTEGYTIHACTNNMGKIIRLPWDMIGIIEAGMAKNNSSSID
ncbi:MAG: putative esterase [Syntrophus sp. SKADARSKE-3]|nr:putative esterase [Syntrophus sp. SKADARSKE-3]